MNPFNLTDRQFQIFNSWRDFGYGIMFSLEKARDNDGPSCWEGVSSDYAERILRSRENYQKYFGYHEWQSFRVELTEIV